MSVPVDNEVVRLPWLLRLMRVYNFPHKLGLMDLLFSERLSDEGVAWVRCSNGVVWKLDLSDVTHRWIVYGDYEGSHQMKWIRNWLCQGGVVLDSGANIGQTLLYFSPLPGVTVHAFEPLSSAYAWLEECLVHYPDWDVILNKCGFSNNEAEIEVQVDGARSTARMDWYKGRDFQRESINVMRLDDYLGKKQIGQVRLWKLDVEGHELEALQGASDCLLEKKIDAILVEVSKYDEVKEYLKRFGYRLHLIGRGGQLEEVIAPGRASRNMVAMPG